jgi:hypothetical protein
MAHYIAVANIMPIRFAFRSGEPPPQVAAACAGAASLRDMLPRRNPKPCHIHFTVGFVWIDVRVGRLTKSESTLLRGNRRIVYCNCERFASARVNNGASPGYGF